MKFDIKAHLPQVLKIAGIVLGVILLLWIFVASGLTRKLLEDKKPKSSINEGEYILNRLAADYEDFLKKKRAELEEERQRLLREKGITLTLAEKEEIERRLRQIDGERRILNDEFQKNLQRKAEIEATYLAKRNELENLTSEKNQISDRFHILKREKSELDSYWSGYLNDLIAFFSNRYIDDPEKRSYINASFSKDSGRQFISNEYASIFSSLSEQQRSLDENRAREAELTESKKGLLQRIQEYQKTIEYYNKYNDVIKKFQNIVSYYNSANSSFVQKNYTKSADDFKKVLKEFDEVKSSYDNLVISEKNLQNEIAKKELDRGLSFIKLKRYNFALESFVKVVQDAPESIYANDAASNIYRILDQLTDQDRLDTENHIAKGLMEKADVDFSGKKYQEALVIYEKVITNYPITRYVKEALDKSIEARSIVHAEKLSGITGEIKKSFDADYKKYEEYLASGNIQRAREFYFEALNNTFGEYSGNTIEKFKRFEDKFIETLIDNYSRQILSLQAQYEPDKNKNKKK